ncbi:YggS family pyridoxal phosphate-dependent enzyme [bacterium]|jgi:PLP dependent protein|nr:YggS family pyridoxal phosphate-dependent enzyme [bacterium]
MKRASERVFSTESLKQRVNTLKTSLNSVDTGIDILAVTKYYEADKVLQLIDAGFTELGENRLQHAIPLIQSLPSDLNWHFIGPIQTNKLSKIVEYFDVIQSVHSEKILNKIIEIAIKKEKYISVYLQVNFTGEENKFGFSEKEISTVLSKIELPTYVKIRGLMAMGPLTDDTNKIKKCYQQVFQCFGRLKKTYPFFETLSMGMTNDFLIAAENGASMVRIGRYFFN